MNNRVDISRMFKALGDPTRLHIYEFLRAQNCEVAVGNSGEVQVTCGPTAGEICCHITGEPEINSTISHHLRELRLANLITMERRGKNMICSINLDSSIILSEFINGNGITVEKRCC